MLRAIPLAIGIGMFLALPLTMLLTKQIDSAVARSVNVIDTGKIQIRLP